MSLNDTTTSVPSSIGSHNEIWLGDNGSALEGDIDVFYTYIFNRALSTEEIRKIMLSPYQILKPSIPPHYFTLAEIIEGWTGIINGVINPTRINGILVADIIRVNGVSSS